jgi:dimethylglycine dehydrogenase
MAEQVRVAVIGGGAAGCSALYHLAKLGWTDALLLEQDELTSGSTWHAAGNCPTFSTSWGILKLQAYSARLYQRLAGIADYPIAYHVTGSVRLSHTPDRLREFRHVTGMAQANGIDYAVLTPGELREKYPLAELHDLNGALWDPLDGDIDPAQLTQAFASAARKLGARVRRFTKVVALSQRPDGAWTLSMRNIKTAEVDEIVAEVVVNAAGYRAGEVMALLGQHLPTVCMSHQYLVTGQVGCRCCAIRTPPGICARNARASFSAPTSGRPRRCGRMASPRILPTNSGTTTSGASTGTSKTRARACPRSAPPAFAAW